MNPLHYYADRDATTEALDRMGVPEAPDVVRAMERTQPDDSPALTLVWRLSWLDAMLRHGQRRCVLLPNSDGDLLVDPGEVAALSDEGDERVGVLLRGSGFAGFVTGPLSAVRARLWPTPVAEPSGESC